MGKVWTYKRCVISGWYLVDNVILILVITTHVLSGDKAGRERAEEEGCSGDEASVGEGPGQQAQAGAT